MAVPKNKSSKSRTSRKHSINGRLSLPKLVKSEESGDLVIRHRIDPATGVYRGKQIIEEKE